DSERDLRGATAVVGARRRPPRVGRAADEYLRAVRGARRVAVLSLRRLLGGHVGLRACLPQRREPDRERALAAGGAPGWAHRALLLDGGVRLLRFRFPRRDRGGPHAGRLRARSGGALRAGSPPALPRSVGLSRARSWLVAPPLFGRGSRRRRVWRHRARGH